MSEHFPPSHFSSSMGLPFDFAVNPALSTKDQLAAALERMAEMDRELKNTRSATIHDPLTGLYNQHYFELERFNWHAEAERGTGYSIVILDLDNFSAVNEAHGREAGDEVLKTMANTLRMKRRLEDRIIRWGGGDEFVVVLPGCGELSDATRIAEKIRANIENSVCELPSGTKIKMTASLGVASIPPLDFGGKNGARLTRKG